jgi:phage FluMu gp28-like protein
LTASLNALRPPYRPDAILLPFQALWYADRSEVKIIEKSRRTGITWTSAAEHADEGATGNCDTWYIGYSEDQGEEFIRDVAQWGRNLHGIAVEYGECLFEDYDPATQKTEAIKAFRVDWASGKRTTALSSRPRNLRGKQGLVTIDEAAYHDDLRGLLKSALAMLIWGARIEIISTHNGIDNEFAKVIEETRAGKFNYSIHRVTLDDALCDGLYKRICHKTRKKWSIEREHAWRANLVKQYGDGAAEELFCEPSHAGASYFNTNVVESRMVAGRPILTLEVDHAFALRGEIERERHVAAWITSELRPLLDRLPRDLEHCVGQDFGRVSDLSSRCLTFHSSSRSKSCLRSSEAFRGCARRTWMRLETARTLPRTARHGLAMTRSSRSKSRSRGTWKRGPHSRQ